MGRPRSKRVWVHLGVAAATIVISVPALLWWKTSILFVIAISLATQLYAALSAAEGADDKAITDQLDRIERLIRQGDDMTVLLGTYRAPVYVTGADGVPTKVGTLTVPLDLARDDATIRVEPLTPEVAIDATSHDDCPDTLHLDAYVDTASGSEPVGMLTCCPECRP